MKLSEKDIEAFKGNSFEKEWFLDFLRRLKVSIFDPQSLTVENLPAKKEAVTIIEENLEKPFLRGGNPKEAATNKEYQ